MSKKNQTACFLTVYLDGEGKQTFEATRKQSRPDTIEIVDGKEIVTKNPDAEVPNEALPGMFARNRVARRTIAAYKRKR